MITHVVSFSGGAQSFVAAQRAVASFGVAGIALVFADTSAEDADLYRFVVQASATLGCALHIVRDGRTPQDVLRQRRWLGGGLGAPCSAALKRVPVDKWLTTHAPTATLVVGLTWEEPHRVAAIQARYGSARQVIAPLTEPPYLTRDEVFDAVRAAGLDVPRLYARGYAHNNCGGACVRAGQGAWRHLQRDNPELFEQWAEFEAQMRVELGDVAILRDRKGGVTRPLPLYTLAAQTDDAIDLFDIGGCGCFSDAPAHEQERAA